jgi:uncharacterized protein DUF2281
MLCSERDMAVERDKLEDLLKQLPEELQNEVLEFAESLLRKRRARNAGGSTENGFPSVRSFFGIWDSGDPRSADNDRIDADLAREYADSHEIDS